MTVFTRGGTNPPVKKDNDIPLEVGWHYNITPGEASSQWVLIESIHRGYVYTKGLEDTTADWAIPVWKFDDLIKGWVDKGFYIKTEEGDGLLATEDGVKLFGA